MRNSTPLASYSLDPDTKNPLPVLYAGRATPPGAGAAGAVGAAGVAAAGVSGAAAGGTAAAGAAGGVAPWGAAAPSPVAAAALSPGREPLVLGALGLEEVLAVDAPLVPSTSGF